MLNKPKLRDRSCIDSHMLDILQPARWWPSRAGRIPIDMHHSCMSRLCWSWQHTLCIRDWDRNQARRKWCLFGRRSDWRDTSSQRGSCIGLPDQRPVGKCKRTHSWFWHLKARCNRLAVSKGPPHHWFHWSTKHTRSSSLLQPRKRNCTRMIRCWLL